MSPPIQFPSDYVEETSGPPPPIIPAATAVTAIVGELGPDLAGQVLVAASYLEFANQTPNISPFSVLALSVKLFFENGGRTALITSSLEALGDQTFNLLCIPVGADDPPLTMELHEAAAALCKDKRAIYLIDPPGAWSSGSDSIDVARREAKSLLPGSANAALYFPRLKVRPDLSANPFILPPSGAIAGLIARTDPTRGVWKAPAGVEAAIIGAAGIEIKLTNREIAILNPEGVNCLRTFETAAPIVWGARVRAGADTMGSEWKYVPVRRLGLFIESSIADSLGWVVFESNGEPLWARIRFSITQYLNDLFRQGAFQGAKPEQAYYVRCDLNTVTPADIESGIVTIEIGFAPLKPAEFIILRIRTRAGTAA